MNKLRALLDPKSIAVVGASSRSAALGQRVVANLHCSGFTGPVLPVHPRHASVLRIHCYRSAADLPFVPDLAVVCTPPEQVAEQLRQLGERGVRAAIVMAHDPDGDAAATPFKEALEAAARPYGMRWLGPRSAGVQLPRTGLNASWLESIPPPGKLALVSQSSSIAASVVAWATGRGIGFSSVITLGDSCNIDAADVLDDLAADGRTQAILLYLDTITDGRKFMASARAVARLKPVVVLWGGSSAESAPGDDPVVAHDFVCKAAFQRSGLLQVSELGDWFDAVETLGYGRRPIGDRLAILSNGHGPARLARNVLSGKHALADLGELVCGEIGKLLPKELSPSNPLSLGVDADGARFEAVMTTLLKSDEVNALLVIVTPSRPQKNLEIAEAITRVAKSRGRMIMVCWLDGRVDASIRAVLATAEISLFDAPEKAAQAYLHLVRFRRSQEALRLVPERLGAGSAPHDLRLSDDAESVEFLQAYGAISSAILGDEPLVSGASAQRVLAAFGFAAGQKGVAPDGTVPLAIVVGNDRVFGRAIEASVGSRKWTLLPALNPELTAIPASELSGEIELVTGKVVPAAAIATALVQVADMIVDFPEIVGVSIRSCAWDGNRLQPTAPVLRVAAHERAHPHLAIHPYPRGAEEQITLRDGSRALVRPLRPADDVPLIEELLANVSRDDLFLRYCRVMKEIPPEIIAKMTRVDYDREMVFVALAAGTAGTPVALGLVDAFVSPDRREAEFAILLRSDLKGTGLGKLLMQKIISYCRERKIGRIVGFVLRENQGMRGLAARLEFATEINADEDMVTVALGLAATES